ncbi:LIC12162 family transferase [Prochlorococcus sp. MIT 1341]|uniref:LIC12162 family transferase n=1 Tax=Prochlorococcus sp. MIT 1341 TaxID=3096221 RepID=UPI002A759853|nr:LIC12162 family protein [Prochlorococcus sp. MIT 1341]
MEKVLVTSGVEKTWPKEKASVLFLGEWCKIYSRRKKWENLEHTTLKYHWDDREKLFKDYKSLLILYESVLEELALILNKKHNTNYSVRYWRILIGPWLGMFIYILYDRWFMLKEAFKKHEINKTNIIQVSEEDLAANDYQEFHSLIVGDKWNEMMCGEIIKFMGKEICYVGEIEAEADCDEKLENELIFESRKNKLKTFIKNLLMRLNRKDSHLIIDTYMDLFKLVELHLRLRNRPISWERPEIKGNQFSKKARSWVVTITQDHKECTEFIELLKTFLPRFMPRIYLEGYKSLVNLTANSLWPKNPKSIFTGGAFFNDDFFKAWTASQVERGIPLFIGQHGGSYGICKWVFEEDHAQKISNNFLTWGWNTPGDSSKCISIGMLRSLPSKVRRENESKRRKNVLLVQWSYSRYSFAMFSSTIGSGQWEEYLNNQFKFVDTLPKVIQDKLIVRLGRCDFRLCQYERWKDRYKNIYINSGEVQIKELLKDTRIYISTYNCTTFLESLALNIPTIIFWDPKHWEIREDAIMDFKLLKEVNIFFDDPTDAANHLKRFWNDVNTWWLNRKTQEIRSLFCSKYANQDRNMVVRLTNLIGDYSKSNMLKAE